MSRKLIYEIRNRCIKKQMGNKAEGLVFLMNHGFNIPKAFIVPYGVYNKYKLDPNSVLSALIEELSHITVTGIKYAVRSSANIEDGHETSYAGQFNSYLNIDRCDDIIEKIRYIWDSADKIHESSYSMAMNKSTDTIKMAVIIQEMVDSDFSGIAFSKNPMTGLNEIIIEAMIGNPEQMTQEGVTPHRWVRKWGNYIEAPAGCGIPAEKIEEICKTVKEIENKYGAPVDVEWAVQKGIPYILQAREITKLDIPIYSNKISREVLPGLIKPLVWSVNNSIVNPNWVSLLHSLVGGEKLDPDYLTGYFFYRAYFNMAAFRDIFTFAGMPGEALELLMGLDFEGPEKPRFKPSIRTFLLLPRIMFFTLRLVFIVRRAGKLVENGREMFNDLLSSDIKSDKNKALMKKINRISEKAENIAYYNIVIPLLSNLVNRICTKGFEKSGVEFNHDYTLYGKDKTYNGPVEAIGILNERFFGNGDSISYEDFINEPAYLDFKEKYGHFSDSGNDFSYIPWRGNPGLVYEMAKDFIKDSESRDNPEKEKYLKILKKKPFLRFIYKKAVMLEKYREEISSLYTYGYGQLRPVFLELGKRLVSAEALDVKEDIFYIYYDELVNVIEDRNQDDLKYLAASRKEAMKSAENLVVPTLVFGNDPPPPIEFTGPSLSGVPTSHGFYTGIAKVLKGTDEFQKLRDGEILVIPYSDVGWTPLFSKAGAVVSESGGILSHSSIVAREYGIPAVVSVENACRIKDGTIISVNGYTGEIHIVSDKSGGMS